MQLSKRHRYALIALGFVIGAVVAGPVLGAIFDNKAEVNGPVPIVSPDGTNATLQGDTNVSLNDPSQLFPDASTVDLKSESGNITATATGNANFSVAADDITGTFTNTSDIDAESNALTIDPEDKAQITLKGAADTADWSDYALDDGNVDLVISGPDGSSTMVTFYGLQPSTAVTAINKSLGTAVAVNTTDSNGNVTLEIPHSKQTVLLKTGDLSSIPQLSNPSPTGEQTSAPSQISIDVSDADFPDDNVSVRIKFDGSQVKQQYIESNSTVTASISPDLGPHQYTVNATDNTGNIEKQTYEFEIPDRLTIRNETNASQLITGVNATITFYSKSGNTIVQFADNDDDGNISMESLPDTEFVAVVETEGYYQRNVYIGSIYEQQNIYLLNETAYQRTTTPDENTAIKTIFSYEDRTGNFPTANTKLRVQRAVDINNDNNSTYDTVAGDFFGAAGEYEFIGEYNERYRLIIENDEGSQRDLGQFQPTEDATKQLTVGDIQFPEKNGSSRYFETELEINNSRILATYNDDTNETGDITLIVYERGNPNNVIFQQRYGGPFGKLEAVIDLTEDQTEKEWTVKYQSTRKGSSISAMRLVGGTSLNFPLDPLWLGTLSFGFITIVGSLYGPRTSQIGGITMVIAAAMLMYFQLVYIAVPMLFVAAIVAVGGVIYDQGRPG